MKLSLQLPAGFTSILLSSTMILGGCSTVQQILPGNSAPDSAAALPHEDRDPTDRVARHFYAATGIGASRMEPDTSEVPLYDVNDRVEAGGQITVGADLSRQLAVELHSADLGSAGLSPGGRINYHIHGASALIYAGKNRHNFKRRGLSGFGRVGVGYLENTPVGNVPYTKDNATHVLFGAGVEYMTRIGLGLRAEGIAYEEDAQYAQLGVIYRTGKREEQKAVQIVKAPEPEPAPIPVPTVVAAAEPDPCEAFDGVLEGVNFHTDSAELTDAAIGVLNGVANVLSGCESVPVSISAHTDSVGSEAYNQGLSERRAASVKTYLGQRGIDTGRIDAQAFGETQPIDSNQSAEGRSRNRRVELIAR